MKSYEDSKEHLPINPGKSGENRTGAVFGLMTVITYLGRNYKDDIVYLCKDIFGAECSVCYNALRRASELKVVADESICKKDKLRRCYYDMLARCYRSDRKYYKYYGAVGVTVCKDWLGDEGFCNFLRWAASAGFQLGLTIDKKDKIYSPSTCRWITKSENSRYTDRTILDITKVLYIKEEYKKALESGTLTFKETFYREMAAKFGCHSKTIQYVITGQSWSDINLEH